MRCLRSALCVIVPSVWANESQTKEERQARIRAEEEAAAYAQAIEAVEKRAESETAARAQAEEQLRLESQVRIKAEEKLNEEIEEHSKVESELEIETQESSSTNKVRKEKCGEVCESSRQKRSMGMLFL